MHRTNEETQQFIAEIPTPAAPMRSWRNIMSRLLATVALLAIVAAFSWFVAIHYVPARGGVDQNGYLRTARLIAEDHRLSFVRKNPWEFAGRMMVEAPPEVHHGDIRIYAKYPFGYPLLAAIGRWVRGPEGMYLVNPICTVLACLLSYFLFRTSLSRFTSLMGVIWLACNPVTLYWTNDPSSHASTLLCVVIGFWGLLSWMQNKDASVWRGMFGAFALGYACTIRYTEFLLIIPVFCAVLLKIRFNLRQYKTALPVLIAWAVPPFALAIACWIGYGAPWITGYQMCKEETAFHLKYFLGDALTNRQGNWETLLFQLNYFGLFLMLPASLVGMTGLFTQNWRRAMVILLWILPSMTLYMFYYWAPVGDERSQAYLRFFLTIFPAMLMAGLWVFDNAFKNRRWARMIGLTLLTMLACSIDLANVEPQLLASQERNLVFREAVDTIHAVYPPAHPHTQANVIFADDDSCNVLDGMGGYELYSQELFQADRFNGYKGNSDPQKLEDPNPLQHTRALEYMKLLGREEKPGQWVARSAADLDADRVHIIEGAFANHQRVAFIVRGNPPQDMLHKRDWSARKLAVWAEPQPPANAQADHLLSFWTNGHRTPIPAPQRAALWTLWEILPKK